MSANPISCQEIEAFERKALISFSAWEFDLICRLDDAVLRVWAGGTPKAKPDPKAPPEAIPAENVKGIRALLRGLTAKKAAQGKK